MKLYLITVTLVVVAVLGGDVDYDRCGGFGTITGLRIGGCQGRVCEMKPGLPYTCEADLYPSGDSPSLSLRVNASYRGIPIPILDTVLENSSVVTGQLYIIKFTIIPNDVLAGEYLPVEAFVYQTGGSQLEEICVGFHVRVNH